MINIYLVMILRIEKTDWLAWTKKTLSKLFLKYRLWTKRAVGDTGKWTSSIVSVFHAWHCISIHVYQACMCMHTYAYARKSTSFVEFLTLERQKIIICWSKSFFFTSLVHYLQCVMFVLTYVGNLTSLARYLLIRGWEKVSKMLFPLLRWNIWVCRILLRIKWARQTSFLGSASFSKFTQLSVYTVHTRVLWLMSKFLTPRRHDDT